MKFWCKVRKLNRVYMKKLKRILENQKVTRKMLCNIFEDLILFNIIKYL